MQKTEENLSQSKYAEHRNVTEGYIARLIKEGRLHLIKGNYGVDRVQEVWVRIINVMTKTYLAIVFLITGFLVGDAYGGK